jgi:hypothetical protein
MIDPRKGINYHEALYEYCLDNDVDFGRMVSSEFEGYVQELSRFELDNKPFWFWVDK